MMPPFDAVSAVLLIPLGAAALLAVLPGYRLTARLNMLAALLTLLCALSLLAARPQPGNYFLVDDLNNVFIVLTTFVGFTTSAFSASYIGHEIETGRLSAGEVRFYHAMYQVLMFAMNLALTANNIGVMWVAIELATLTTVLMVGIYRTHEAIEAAWKYFILGSVGIAFALFGTILVYMAAQTGGGRRHRRHGVDRARRACRRVRPGAPQRRLRVHPARLRHQGRPGAAACLAAGRPRGGSDADFRRPFGTAPERGALCAPAFQDAVGGQPCRTGAGAAHGDHGSLSLVFAAFMLYRRRDIKRLFAYSSIEHMGIIVFAFGMGGPLANFAGLLHMTLHSLTKSAIFFAVGHISQVKGTQRIADIGGLTETHPALGWGLVLGVVAIAGLPPLGIFMSEFLVVSSTFARQPLLAVPLVIGLTTGFGALLLRLNGIAFGEPRGASSPAKASYVPMFAHLALVLAAGIYLPPQFVAWFQHVARLLG